MNSQLNKIIGQIQSDTDSHASTNITIVIRHGHIVRVTRSQEIPL